jgi:hypothetical protein
LEPRGSRVEVKLAMPFGFSLALPRVVEPLAKVTLPAGTAVSEPDAALTLATSSMGAPCMALAAEAVRVKVTLAVIATFTDDDFDGL